MTKNTLLKDVNASGFTLDGVSQKIKELNSDKTGYRTQEALELKAGTAYLFEITANKSLEEYTLKQKAGEKLREPIAKEKMFSHETMKAYIHSYLRLLKSLEWMKAMAFAPAEVEYFAKEGVLNLLPIEGKAEEKALNGLYHALVKMLDYNALKKKISIKDAGLMAFFNNPEASYKVEDIDTSILFKYVPWDANELDDLMTHYGYELEKLDDISKLQKLATVFERLKTMGLSSKELLSITNGQSLETMLTAKYNKASWLKLTQKIYDELRVTQRDALVAYVLQTFQNSDNAKHIDTPDKLFEYFLIDVQMDACMKTSRIKQAISSVQIFVDRCLYNLEASIAPNTIDAKMWEWMKRYRVWEANRKVFLHPENWLDPSLRSTKSPFFKEFEGELLQADINHNLASQALLGYLEKLDRVSQLEVTGMCKDDDDRLHVIARTAGMKKVYYYRNYDGAWSPWEKIALDLEDGPVIPVWWKGRLFLFWTTVLQKGREETINTKEVGTIGGSVKLKIEVNLNWSEFYNGKWQEKRMVTTQPITT